LKWSGFENKMENDFVKEQIDELFNLVDENHDGVISKQEWVQHAHQIPFFHRLHLDKNQPDIVTFNHRAVLGEGPHWDSVTKTLYWIDILGKKVFSHDRNGHTSAILLEKSPGCLVPTSHPNTLLVACQNSLELLNTNDHTCRTWLSRSKMETKPENRFNDGKVDPFGRLWVGTVAFSCQGTEGTLFSVNPDGTFKKRRGEVGISNGLAWTRDSKVMYFIDSPTRKIVAFDYDVNTGDLTFERTVVTVPDTNGQVPDGMTIDSEGMLWVAIWGGSKVCRYNPNGGQILRELQVPALNVTSCCFGGENLDVLYVTSASCDTDLKKWPQAGFTFEYKNLGVKGVPMSSFSLK